MFQELEDCLNEVHLQISEELDKTYSSPASQHSDDSTVSCSNWKYQLFLYCRYFVKCAH